MLAKALERSALLMLLTAVALTVTLFVLAGFARSAPQATTRYVAPSGICGGPTPCYATLQSAIDAASSGDEIRLATGVYTDVQTRGCCQQVGYISQTLIIRGGYATSDWTSPHPLTQPTTIDAQSAGRGLFVIGNITVTMAGLQIINGNSFIGGSLSFNGGGLASISATLTVSDSLFMSNTATNRGGAFYSPSGQVRLLGNRLERNSASFGGGLAADGDFHITLVGNWIVSNLSPNSGGGLFATYTGQFILDGNQILSNTISVGSGGGMYLQQASAVMSNTLVRGNVAGIYGGGLDFLTPNDLSVINSVVADNTGLQGAGLYIDDSYGSRAIISQTTFARNTGGSGVFVNHLSGSPGDTRFANVIAVSHTLGISTSVDAGVSVDGVLWFGNGANFAGEGIVSVTHEITGAPAFQIDGYHLLTSSAAIDQGINAGIKIDIDGQPRPIGFGFDLGADEFPAFKVFLPLALKNF